MISTNDEVTCYYSNLKKAFQEAQCKICGNAHVLITFLILCERMLTWCEKRGFRVSLGWLYKLFNADGPKAIA